MAYLIAALSTAVVDSFLNGAACAISMMYMGVKTPNRRRKR